MEKVTAGNRDLIVRDLYEIRALIQGFVSNGEIIYPGFINEKSLTEGTKRIANKIAKQIGLELEAIDRQRIEISEYQEEGKTENELKSIRAFRDKELLDDPIDLSVEKLDFKRVENMALSGNYQFLYDTIFKE